jgi:hypothetical protein
MLVHPAIARRQLHMYSLSLLPNRAREIKEELEERLEDEEGGAPEGVVPEGYQRPSGESPEITFTY